MNMELGLIAGPPSENGSAAASCDLLADVAYRLASRMD